MDQLFEEYDMIEEKKCRLAELKLVHQARFYWEDVERIIRLRGHDPIVT